MLKYRIISAVFMIAFLGGVLFADAWWDGSLSEGVAERSIQATGVMVLVAVLLVPAVMELRQMAASVGVRLYWVPATVFSILAAGGWYVAQFEAVEGRVFLAAVLAGAVVVFFLWQYFAAGTEGVIVNCGASCLAVLYCGVLGGFFLAIRIDVGFWAFLMFVSVVKAADIGAYTFGKMWGRRRFSPRVSPKKSWEGMAGAVVFAVIVSLVFARTAGIMGAAASVGFGVCFAFAGQLADLAESMLKRDAGVKDSANKVPGFGGVLDVVDSPLAAAPLAYLFMVAVGAG